MKLEEIAKMYGMHDYYDMHTGRTYALSQAKQNPDNDNMLRVPVYEGNGQIGTAIMEKQNG